MILTIASGKGGTGKTTFSVNLAKALADRGDRVRLLDCDVEEPNDHLFVQPEFTSEEPVYVRKPVWDAERCTACGQCAEVCNYNAMAVVKEKVLIFNELCHSCGACAYICPADALREEEAQIGRVQTASASQTCPFFFAHGLLNIGEALAPNVVRAVKKHIDPDAINIIDAAPGTACPVVEAVRGADAVLLVTEPTPFGLNDLKLAAGLSLKMGVPTGIIVNRSDGEDRLIADFAKASGILIAGRIPFKRAYAEAYSEGAYLTDRFPAFAENILNIFDTCRTASPSALPADAAERPASDAPPFEQGEAAAYRELTVISGKGGTGKTTVLASLAQLAEHAVLADNDVDAADLHLLLQPDLREAHPFVGGAKAAIDPAQCVGCGRCAEACHFEAIRLDGPPNDVIAKTYRVDPLACEGCGLCPRVCPADAIRSEENVTGHWFVSGTACGPMAHARLGIAEENSGRLVSRVRERAGELARSLKRSRIIGDGSPGTGCPVIASISGADRVLIVTEPTVSGVHDMERVLQLAAHFRIPASIVINKADLNSAQAERIDSLAREHGADLLGRIPFDPAVHRALMAGRTVLDYEKQMRTAKDGESVPAAQALRDVWQKLKSLV